MARMAVRCLRLDTEYVLKRKSNEEFQASHDVQGF